MNALIHHAQRVTPRGAISVRWAPRLTVIGCILSAVAGPRVSAAQPDSDEVAQFLDKLAQGAPPVAALVHQTSASPPELVDRISEALAGDTRFARHPTLVRAHEALSMLGGGRYESGYAQLMAGLRQPAVRRVAAVALAFQSAPEKRPEIAAALVAEVEAGGLSLDEIAGLLHPIGQLGEAATGLLPHVKQVLEAPLTTDREKSLALRAVARISGGQEALRTWKDLGRRNPLLLLHGLAQFADETEGMLDAPVATRIEFRKYVLDFLGSSEPELRKAALEALAPAFGRELVVQTDGGYEPNPQIGTRLMNLAEVHPDPHWRQQMTQFLREVQTRADRFGRRGGPRDARPKQKSDRPDEIGWLRHSALPLPLHWPSEELPEAERRIILKSAVRRLVELHSGAAHQKAAPQEQEHLDEHVALWAHPVDLLSSALLTRDGAIWYLESVDAFRSQYVEALKRPVDTELRGTLRTLVDCGLARRWVTPDQRMIRRKHLLELEVCLSDSLRRPSRTIRLTGPNGVPLDDLSQENAVAALSAAAVTQHAHTLSMNIFFARAAASLDEPPVWPVILRDVFDQVRIGRRAARQSNVQQALPHLLEAAFWYSWTRGDCSQKMYRGALNKAGKTLDGDSSSLMIP